MKKIPIKDNNGVEMYHIDLDRNLIVEIAKLLHSLEDDPEIRELMREDNEPKE